jgi:hypothetical protein
MTRASFATILPLLALAGIAPAQGEAPPDPPKGLFGLPAAPIDEPLVTDRPDFTESTLAVPVGRAQLEAGLTFTRDNPGGGSRAESVEAPEALLRLGLARGFELRIGAPSYAWADDGAADENGATDLSLGFKFELATQEGARPSLAVLAELSLPTGADAFTSDSVDPGVILAWAYDLGESGWSVAGNAGVSSLGDGADDRFEEFSASLALGIPLTGALGAFAEYYTFLRNGAGSGPEHYFNTGLTCLLGPNTQLDARVGAGLNERSDDFFAGVGVSFRF